MTALVLSDIHGRRDRVEEVLARHRNTDAVLFLGDGIRSLPYEACTAGGRLFAGVRGNCDGFCLFGDSYVYTEELLLNLGEYTVMMMHGHTRSVKSGIERGARYAAERGADLLLYGHTHVPEERYFPAGTEIGGYVLQKPLWVMNPGSIGEPRGGNPSFGVVELRHGQILLSHGTL
ncbi:MAG: YfcE family phosphodiesterase [Clostridia bacterium]|nr:YfcE family phosphodiesterase [Clostridia bacterium]